MQNVMIFAAIDTEYHGGKGSNVPGGFSDEQVLNYFRAQVDNCLDLGYKKEDIIIGTNFDFEHNGVKNHHIKDICTWSGYNNFWFGTLELMKKGIINDDFWLHDHDSWQNTKFDFPNFEGEMAGCEYQDNHQWNCASIYCKKSSQYIFQYLVDLMNENREKDVSSDEEWISFCRGKHYGFNQHLGLESPVEHLMSSLNPTYNCGFTNFKQRYENAEKPINVFSFKPDSERDCPRVISSVDERLIKIFEKNNILLEGANV